MQALYYKVVLGRTLRKLCSTKYYCEVLCASFVLQSSTGNDFAQALYYTLVPGNTWCKLSSAKYYQ